MSLTEQITLPASLSGVGQIGPVEVPATRYRQGGRVQFHITIPVLQVARLVQKPDPAQPLDGNRKVDLPRAKKFASYLRKHREWVSPAIIVRAPAHELDFVPSQEFGNGTSWGVLRIPLDLVQQLLLLDGQHRSLGFVIAEEDTRAEMTKLKALLQKQREQGQPIEYVEATEQQIDREEVILRRLREEHVSIDIVEVTIEQSKQMFADINNNAKGVNPDYTTVLDQRNVINRIAIELSETHPLLIDNVEVGQSARMSPSNEHLLGAKAVADIVRAVLVGGTGRVGSRVEDELNRNQAPAIRKVAAFFDVLTASFSGLGDVAAGRLTPIALREDSMLASQTMLRVLAATYRQLTDPDAQAEGVEPMTRSEVEDFFRRLSPHMSDIPIAEDDALWMPTKAFLAGNSAPQARQGTIKSLVDQMVLWARGGNPAL
jgi:hypothetical protein